MNNSNLNLGEIEDSGEKPPLLVVFEVFKGCYDRAFRQVGGAPIPDPDQNKDLPLDLDLFRQAINTFELNFADLDQKVKAHLRTIELARPNVLVNRFPYGQRYCYNLVPFSGGFAPSIDLYLLSINSSGLTYGLTSDPAYYYLNFPKEIQEKCTFRAPFYQNLLFASQKEKEELKENVQKSWDNLCDLLNLKPV